MYFTKKSKIIKCLMSLVSHGCSRTSDFCDARLFMTTLPSVAVKVRASICDARLFMTTPPSVVVKVRALFCDARLFMATLPSVVVKVRAVQTNE